MTSGATPGGSWPPTAGCATAATSAGGAAAAIRSHQRQRGVGGAPVGVSSSTNPRNPKTEHTVTGYHRATASSAGVVVSPALKPYSMTPAARPLAHSDTASSRSRHPIGCRRRRVATTAPTIAALMHASVGAMAKSDRNRPPVPPQQPVDHDGPDEQPWDRDSPQRHAAAGLHGHPGGPRSVGVRRGAGRMATPCRRPSRGRNDSSAPLPSDVARSAVRPALAAAHRLQAPTCGLHPGRYHRRLAYVRASLTYLLQQMTA